jgi:hypothetical protein
MKNITKIIVATAVAVAVTQTVHATAITGTIGFSGVAQLDGNSVTDSSEVLSWGANNVGITSGSFAGLSGSSVTFGNVPWLFSSAETSFWTVGGFTFNLLSTTVTTPVLGPSGYYSLTIFLAGTVTSSTPGLNPTAFAGSFSIQGPAVGGNGCGRGHHPNRPCDGHHWNHRFQRCCPA